MEAPKDVPTYGEKSLFSNNDPSWFGLPAATGAPVAAVHRIHQALVTALQGKALREKLAGMGLVAFGTKPDESVLQIRKEIEKMQRTAKFYLITLD